MLATIEAIARAVPVVAAVAPSAVAGALWRDRPLLVSHTTATIIEAGLGLGIAWAISLLLSAPIAPKPVRVVGRHTIAIVNALPLVAVVPLLALLVDRTRLPVLFATLAGVPVVWPVVDQWMAASSRVIESSPLALYAPRGWRRLRLLGLAALVGPLPQVLRAGAPLCVFGATLAGFVNAERGLGVYLAVAMWQGDTSKVLAGACVTSALCVCAFSAAGILEKLRPGDMGVALEQRRLRLQEAKGRLVLQVLGTLGTAFVLWIAIGIVADNPVFFKLPHEVFDPAIYKAGTGSKVAKAAGQTMIWSSVGLVVGFATACSLVAISALAHWTRWATLPVVFVSQTIPLTVLVSIIVILCGRGFVTAMVFATSVTFLSAFLIVQGGMNRLWLRYGDLCEVFGRRRSRFAVCVLCPGAREYLIRALAVSAPRAILGVILAEYLVLRSGLGGLIYEARGRMEIHFLWLLVTLVAGVGVILQSLFPSSNMSLLTETHQREQEP